MIKRLTELMLIVAIILSTGCSTLDTACDLLLIFDDDTEEVQGTVIMGDGTVYEIKEVK